MSRACREFIESGRFSRRRLLQAGTAGIAGLALPALLKAEQSAGRAPRHRHIILLHQFGGPSHLDTFDMKPDAPDRDPRRVQADRLGSARPAAH